MHPPPHPCTQVIVIPRHKKYEPAGKKAVLRTSQLWIDQADARELHDGEEITLMDWGNAIVKVRGDGIGAVVNMGAPRDGSLLRDVGVSGM